MCDLSSESIVARSQISALQAELLYKTLRIKELELQLNSLAVIPISQYVWEPFRTYLTKTVLLSGESDV